MTFFLTGNENGVVSPTVLPNIPLPSFWDGTQAAGGMEWQDADVARQRSRQVIKETDTVAADAAKRIGLEGMRSLANERNRRAIELGMPSQVIEGETPEDIAARLGPNGARVIVERARELAAADPASWQEIDLSDEGIESRVTERRAKELAENQAILSMSPMSGLASVTGTIGAAIADPVNLGLSLFSGGGGSLLRIMGREAIVNATAEAMTLPARFRTAEELDKAPPDILQTLAIGAAGGAALGGGIEGVARGLRYMQTRETITPSPGVDPVRQAAAIDAAEDAIIAGENPAEAVEAVLQPRSEPESGLVRPEAAEVAPPAREPLVPDPVTPAGVPVVTTEPLIPPKPAQNIPENITDDAALAQEAVDVLRSTDARVKRPLSDWIKSSPKRGEDLRIDPAGPLGQELKARGVNSRTYPGLFKKGGRGDLDNLVASEMEETFPGISSAAGVDADYLDARGLAEVLIRDAQGDATWLNSRTDLLAAEKAAFDAENPNRTAVRDYQEGLRAPGGFFVDKTGYDFAGGDVEGSIARDFDRWSQDRGFDRILTPGEREEILAQLSKDGGDAEYLVERVLEREQDWVDGPEDGATGGIAGAGESSGDPPWDFPGQTGGGAARAEGSGLASERTAAGEQTLIPGVAPVARSLTRPAPVRGPQEADSQIGGMFDLANLSMRDMFDDPEGPKAQAFLDSQIVDLRAEVEAGDVPLSFEGAGLMTDDGRPITSLQGLLDEIDDYDTLAREIELCRTGGAQ